jgi:hypothetical protein
MLYIFCEHLKDVEDASSHDYHVVIEDNIAQPTLQSTQLKWEPLFQLVQEGHEVCLVVSAKTCSIHHVKVPKVKNKDLPLVLQSLLEDKLTQDFSELQMYYQKHQEVAEGCEYRVFLWDKAYIQNLLRHFKGLGVLKLTMDWFALQPQECLLDEKGNALVYTDEIQGWMSASLFKQQTLNAKRIEGVVVDIWMVEQFSHLGLVDILLKPKAFDIHALLPRAKFEPIFIRSVTGLMVIVGIAWVMFFAKNIEMYFQNHHTIQSYAEKPSESLTQKLALYQRQQMQKNKFWDVYIPLQKIYIPGLQIKQITYRQNKLQVSLVVQQIQMIQLLKARLSGMHLKVEDTQVVSEQQGTRAVLTIEKY